MLFLLIVSILLSIPTVQTKLGKYATNRINNDFGTNLSIHKIDLSFLGNVELKGVEIRDHHKDTLIFIDKLSTSLLSASGVLDNKILLGDITMDGVLFYMKTYKGEKDDNMAVFIDSFGSNSPKDSTASPFILKASDIFVNNLNFRLEDYNNKKPLSFSASKTGGNIQDLAIKGPDFSLKTRGLYFVDNHGLQITNLTTDYFYSKTSMKFKNTILQTVKSNIRGDINFTYKRQDLTDFNNKVTINANFNNSKIAVQDLKKFYSELSGNDLITFNAIMKGKLNDFDLKNLDLRTRNGIRVKGDLLFVNSLKPERGFIFEGDLDNLSATYNELRKILPNVLGKTLPSEFTKFGRFGINGNVRVTPEQMSAVVDMTTEIGDVSADLQLGNIDDIDYANYNGEVSLLAFDIGKFFDDPIFGKITLKGDVDGSGFKLDNINTSFIGEVSELTFKGYTYKNIVANGQYQNNKFDGDLIIDDPNLKMKFNGLADLSSKVNKFDFESDITYLNLKETNLFVRDSLSELKGKIELDIEGNTLDDIVGNATFKNILYTNQNKEFTFKKFTVTSALKDSIKTIEVASKDIVNGKLSGKFTFSELFSVSQNALGSIYNNYEPYKVTPNQYINFDFTIYNQIVDVFFPKISIDDKTKIKGKINSDKNLFRLNFTSPRINIFGNEAKEIKLITDNKNPIYDTHLTAKEINTKYYDVSKLNLLSKKRNDTLFFKSVFTGKEKKEDFNLDFFYTFNQEGKSVIGFEESSFNYQETVWNINPDKKNTDKIIFDLNKGEFEFSQFKLVSGEQEIEFIGNLKGNSEKNLLADFTKVKLQSFLPVIDSLALKGELSGHLDFIQKDNKYAPEALLQIKNFEVNDFKQGDLALNISGDNSYEKYNIDVSINNKKAKSLAAVGSLDFSLERPIIDVEVFMEEFALEAFSPLGQDVLSSLRGTASGDFYLRGFLGNPEMSGEITLKNAGLKFPFLNVDYDFEGDAVISLQQQSFIFEDFKLRDTKHNTTGRLLGNITHQNFKLWFLDLEIDTDNLLVLNTKNSPEALYYGTAFMDGSASISGLTDQLTIDVNGKTMPGTVFVVPLKDVETVDSYKLIHFKNDNLKVNEKQEEVAIQALKGLSLNIDLEVTKDATAQVVIDEVYGSQLTGNGSGNLQIEINTRGKFLMFGDYTIDSGVYDFKYGGIINKPFLIQKGGVVSWNGDPYEANIDVTAVYKAKANPGVLLQNFNSNRRIDVDLVTRITGTLFDSKQELDIQLNNVDPTIASELEFVLNDNNINQKTTQFISLLAFNNFANPDRVDFNPTSAFAGTASSAVAAAFSNLLNSPDSKFQIGVDYQQNNNNANLDRLNLDNQVDVSLSTQVSDRVIINGKVGVPVGAQTQSSVVGEVKVEVLLNKDGTFRGVIFNRQNEIQFSLEDQGYTQGVGLSYQVNFNTLSELLQKIGLKKKNKKSKKLPTKKDSINKKSKEFDNFQGN